MRSISELFYSLGVGGHEGGPISLDGIIPLFFALDLSISLDGIIPLFFALDLSISLDGIIPLFFALDLSISLDGIKKLYSFCGFLVGCPHS